MSMLCKQLECGKPATCRGYCQTHYYSCYAHPKRRKQRLLMILANIGGRCQRCNKLMHMAEVEFHHTDPVQRESDVSVLVKASAWPTLLEELRKCEVICHTCHRLHHATNSDMNYQVVSAT